MKKTSLLLIIGIPLLAGCSLLQKATTGLTIPGTAKNYNVKTLKAAIDLGIPLKCSYQIGDNQYQGFIKGHNWRGKMKTQEGVGDVIIKDECMWSWSEEQGQGVKMCFDLSEEDKSIWDQDETNAPDIDYVCAPTAVSDDLFNPPTNIQFMDLDDMMMGGNMTGGPEE